MNLSMKQTHREQTCGYHRGGCAQGMHWEFGVGRYKLLHTEWINKVPLYSTGNYIQYSGINYNGKEYKKVYIYIYESLYCTTEINNTVNQLHFSKKNIDQNVRPAPFPPVSCLKLGLCVFIILTDIYQACALCPKWCKRLQGRQISINSE